MKYLKYFESLNNDIGQFIEPDKFDSDSLEEFKSIFDEFAEDNNYYKYKWTLESHPEEEGIHYTYFTWADLENQPNESKNKLAVKIANDMLNTKYFQMIINVNEKLKKDEEIPHWRDRRDRHYKPFKKVVDDIEKYFIPRVESIGYKVTITFGSMSSNDTYTHQVNLKIDYSQA
jgi:hypothetical protein